MDPLSFRIKFSTFANMACLESLHGVPLSFARELSLGAWLRSAHGSVSWTNAGKTGSGNLVQRMSGTRLPMPLAAFWALHLPSYFGISASAGSMFAQGNEALSSVALNSTAVGGAGMAYEIVSVHMDGK